jgi:hypothetical protein
VKAVAVTHDGKTTAVFHGIAHTPKNALPGRPPDTKNVTCDLMVTLYDTAALAKSDKTAPQPLLSWKTDEPLRGGRGGPVSLAFSPNGKTLLAAFGDPYTDPKAEGRWACGCGWRGSDGRGAPPGSADAPGFERQREQERDAGRLAPLANPDRAADRDYHEQGHIRAQVPRRGPRLWQHDPPMPGHSGRSARTASTA